MKTTYENIKPEITNYEDYKNFCKDRFQQILQEKLFTENTNTNYCKLGKFLQSCINTFNIFAPRKKKYSRGNNMTFTDKNHMKRSSLRNLYLTLADDATIVDQLFRKLKKIIHEFRWKKTQIINNYGGQLNHYYQIN